MKIGVPKETFPGERRVALVPVSAGVLIKAGCEVVVETGAGQQACLSDDDYREKGCQIAASRAEAFDADVVLQVRCVGANLKCGRDDIPLMRSGQIVIGLCDPLGEPQVARDVAGSGASLMSLELIPRITRAQSMDVLSSMATVAGYKAVLLAALELPKMFPLMMTAAGTLSPARVFVIGGGVAGLQAIATARRLGAVVQAYDVRPAVREQVESLGGKFVELSLEAGDTEDKGGYAKAMDDEFYARQRAFMAEIAAESDVVICTAAIPGKKSPVLITDDAIQAMHDGSVIVDLAAERGGNCEASEADQRVVRHNVTILGPTNLAGEVAQDASQMFAKNISTFLLNMIKDGTLDMDMEDEIVRETLLTHHGEVVQPRIRQLLDLPPLEAEPAVQSEPSDTNDQPNA